MRTYVIRSKRCLGWGRFVALKQIFAKGIHDMEIEEEHCVSYKYMYYMKMNMIFKVQ